MPETMIQSMLNDGSWMVGIVRTDTWGAAFSTPGVFEDVVTKGEQWTS